MSKNKCDCINTNLTPCENNPNKETLEKHGLYYHIRALIRPDEDCLLDLWIDEALGSPADVEQLGKELIAAIQGIMNMHVGPKRATC